MNYLAIIEDDRDGCSAYVPDLPGCVAAGDTEEEVRRLIREAIDLHLADMRATGQEVPRPTARADYVQAAP